MAPFDTGGRRKIVLGVVHLDPLPGTPYYRERSFDQLIVTGVQSARALCEGGADGCLIQTVDRVYEVSDDADPARTAAMALIVRAVRQATGDDFHVGVQIMRNAVKASLAVAKLAGGSFVRVGAIVGATLTNDGLVESHPLDVMTYRRRIEAQAIIVVADIHSMQFRWFGAPKATAEVAVAAIQAGADAVALGDPEERTTLDMIASVRKAVPGSPVFLAGYTTHENAARLLSAADGAFVGTCLEFSRTNRRIDLDRVRSYVKIVRALDH